MSLVVHEEGLAPIPEDLAARFGIREGSQIEWSLWLSALVKGVPFTADGAGFEFGALVNGDVDGDNQVGPSGLGRKVS